jgi:hypothetical protein
MQCYLVELVLELLEMAANIDDRLTDTSWANALPQANQA